MSTSPEEPSTEQWSGAVRALASLVREDNPPGDIADVVATYGGTWVRIAQVDLDALRVVADYLRSVGVDL